MIIEKSVEAQFIGVQKNTADPAWNTVHKTLWRLMAAVLLALQITRNIVKKIGGLHEDASKREVRESGWEE